MPDCLNAQNRNKRTCLPKQKQLVFAVIDLAAMGFVDGCGGYNFLVDFDTVLPPNLSYATFADGHVSETNMLKLKMLKLKMLKLNMLPFCFVKE